MDKINKNLLKIPQKQRRQVMDAVDKIVRDQLSGLDIKKVKHVDNIFRVRVGRYRIIFTKQEPGQNIIHMIGKRDEKTYKDY